MFWLSRAAGDAVRPTGSTLLAWYLAPPSKNLICAPLPATIRASLPPYDSSAKIAFTCRSASSSALSTERVPETASEIRVPSTEDHWLHEGVNCRSTAYGELTFSTSRKRVGASLGSMYSKTAGL